jgi:PAS domain S-box-containing protein
VDGIFLSDIECHYVDVNSAGHTMLGYTREEVLSCTIADVIAPEELSRLAHEVAKLTEGQVARSEWRFRRKDGSEFIGEVVGRQLPDGRLIAILRDITERKKAEDQIRFLMGEVIHRSKNILAMVQAIARLSAKHADPVTFASDLSQRISSLSACQNLLVSSEWKGVDVAELVHTQLAPYRDIFDRRILLDGPTARLNSTAAQAVGMALHELATNAAKYGALSNHEGRVRVAWEIDARAETPMFSITWREEGGPKVAVPIRKGFGQNVIISMVENAVHGKVALEYQEAGVVWTLRSPVDASVDMD